MVSKLASYGKSTSILLHIELVYSRQDSVRSFSASRERSSDPGEPIL